MEEISQENADSFNVFMFNKVIAETAKEYEEQLRKYFKEVKNFNDSKINSMFEKRYETLSEDYKSSREKENGDDFFYSTTLGYLVDLTIWEACGMYKELAQEIIKIIDKEQPKTLIDYGAGTGFFCVLLKKLYPQMNITYIDMYGETFNFAQYMFKYYNYDKDIIVMDYRDYMKSNIKSDVLVSLDVLEHLENFIPYIEKWTTTSDNLIFNCVWSKDNGMQPMHYEYKTNLLLLMLGYGYVSLNPIFYKKLPKGTNIHIELR